MNIVLELSQRIIRMDQRLAEVERRLAEMDRRAAAAAAVTSVHESARPCGCDPGAHHVCAWHSAAPEGGYGHGV